MQRVTHLTAAVAALTLAGAVSGAWAAAQAPKPAAPTAGPVKPAGPPDFPKIATSAVLRALPLLQSSAVTFSSRQDCLSCHHQLMTAVVVDAARRRGFKVDDNAARSELAFLRRHIDMLKPVVLASEKDPQAEKQVDFLTVDPAATGGYVLAALQAVDYPKDGVAGAFALYVGRKQREDGRWAVLAARPPSEASDFSATALAIRGLKAFAPTDRAAEAEGRIARGRLWLEQAVPRGAEDRAFRLLGLKWAGASPAALAAARKDIEAHQEDDGGWAQLPGMATDAYATGLTLWALREATGMTPDDPVYSRGYIYLLFRQRPDGSWQVTSRSQPVQPYFETGFPHKKDQFISAHATAFALLGLLPAAEPPGR
jgi:hypothetical protein